MLSKTKLTGLILEEVLSHYDETILGWKLATLNPERRERCTLLEIYVPRHARPRRVGGLRSNASCY